MARFFTFICPEVWHFPPPNIGFVRQQTDEIMACYPRIKEFTFGGVRNTEVPNYLYRWNEWEVKKSQQALRAKALLALIFSNHAFFHHHS